MNAYSCSHVQRIFSPKVNTAYKATANLAWVSIVRIMGKDQSSKGSLPLARCCRGDRSQCPLERIKCIVILRNVTMTVM